MVSNRAKRVKLTSILVLLIAKFQKHSLLELSENFQAENTHISQKCRPYALPFLCYHNFGYCEMKRGKPKKVRICKNDCEDLR